MSIIKDSKSENRAANWAERKRLEFIERVLYWRGWINRRDLIAAFGVSMPQATKDLTSYSTFSNGTCSYNIRSKRYEAGDEFKPSLILPQIWPDLSSLESSVWDTDGVPLLAIPELPARKASDAVYQKVSRAVFARQALTVKYWSAHSGRAVSRKISPRAFAYDGLRIHVRAFCHDSESFKDFNLSRIEKVINSIDCPFTELEDEDWQCFVEIQLSANPSLNEVTRKALERDYGMKRGKASFKVRKALVIYATRRLGFINIEQQNLPLLNELQELQLNNILTYQG